MLNQLRPGKVAPRTHPERSPFSAGEWSRPLRILIDDEEVEGFAGLETLQVFGAVHGRSSQAPEESGATPGAGGASGERPWRKAWSSAASLPPKPSTSAS